MTDISRAPVHPTAFSEEQCTVALSELRSGSLNTILRGLRSLRTQSTGDASVLAPMVERLVNEEAFTLVTQFLDKPLFPDEIRMEVSWLLVSIAISQEGIDALFELGVPSMVLSLFDAASPTLSHTDATVLADALSIIGNTAGSGPSYVAALMDAGVYRQCLAVMCAVVSRLDSDNAPVGLLNAASGALVNFFRFTPPPVFTPAELDVHALIRCFLALNPRSHGRALQHFQWIFSSVFSSIVPDVDPKLLLTTGLLPRMLALSRCRVGVQPTLRVLVYASSLPNPTDAAAILDADCVFNWLSDCAASPRPEISDLVRLLEVLSNISGRGAPLLRRFTTHDLFGRWLQGLADRLRTAARQPSAIEWRLCESTSWVLFNLAAARTAPERDALVRAGAVAFVAAALSSGVIYALPDARSLVRRLAFCAAKLISAAPGPARDEQWIAHAAHGGTHGGELANPVLMMYCAHGGGVALAVARAHGGPAATALVAMLYDAVIGPMIGAEISAGAGEEMPEQFAALYALNRVAPA